MAFLSEKLISASAAEETDDDFNLVTGLYHFDGSNGAQNNTFTGVGASGASQSWTRNGSPTQGSFSPFSTEEGKWSVEFDGTDDYLSIPTSDDFSSLNLAAAVQVIAYEIRVAFPLNKHVSNYTTKY